MIEDKSWLILSPDLTWLIDYQASNIWAPEVVLIWVWVLIITFLQIFIHPFFSLVSAAENVPTSVQTVHKDTWPKAITLQFASNIFPDGSWKILKLHECNQEIALSSICSIQVPWRKIELQHKIRVELNKKKSQNYCNVSIDLWNCSLLQKSWNPFAFCNSMINANCTGLITKNAVT